MGGRMFGFPTPPPNQPANWWSLYHHFRIFFLGANSCDTFYANDLTQKINVFQLSNDDDAHFYWKTCQTKFRIAEKLRQEAKSSGVRFQGKVNGVSFLTVIISDKKDVENTGRDRRDGGPWGAMCICNISRTFSVGWKWKMRRRIHFPPISQISSFHRGPPTRNERYQVQLTFCGPVLEEGTHLLYRNKIKVETSHVGAIEEFVWDYGCVK